MNDSLSVVFPLWNSHATIVPAVAQYLDILGELTSTFEIILVDDGSTDGTLDAAIELAMLYPQVQIARHPLRRGRWAVMRSGLSHAAGDWVLYRDVDCEFDAGAGGHLWPHRRSVDVVVARWRGASGLGAIPQPPRRSGASAAWLGPQPRLVLVRRACLAAWNAAPDSTDWLTHLLQAGCSFKEIELTQRFSAAPAPVSRAAISRRASGASAGDAPRPEPPRFERRPRDVVVNE